VSKKIYVLVWMTESSDRGVDGYWNRKLTDAEQHGYFKEHYPDDYDVDGSCYIHWEMIELKGLHKPCPLPKKLRSDGI